jgi:hypothetical protein
MPPVLDRVLCSARQVFCNLSPLIAKLFVDFQQHGILLFIPTTLLDGRVEVIVPALADLLANAPRDLCCNA